MLLPKKSKIGFTNRQEAGSSQVLPAPFGGLNTRDPLSAMKPNFATQLQNWFPTQSGVQLRKGSVEWAMGLSAVGHLRPWTGPTSEKFFAFTGSGAYEVTTSGAVGGISTPLTSGACSSVMFTTSGGAFLFVVNGVDSARYYDGSSWTVTASYSISVGSGGGTVNSSSFSVVQSFKRMLFFVEKNSGNIFFLPVDSIAGTVSKFPLGALMSKGGRVVAIGTWTTAGGTVIDDFIAFVTSEGQAIVYQGTDPSDASAWRVQGVYSIGRPLGGSNAVYKLGADLLILTEFGLTSMTKVLAAATSDERTTLSDIIAPTFQAYASAFGGLDGWQVSTNKNENLLVVNVPRSSVSSSQLAYNLATGAWTEFTDWNATAWMETRQGLFFAAGGKTFHAWTPTDDAGRAIAAYAKTAWTYLSPRGHKKRINLIKPTMTIGGKVVVAAAVDTDFRSPLDYLPAFEVASSLDTFDNPLSLWNEAQWGTLPDTQLDWLSFPSLEGYCMAVRLRLIARNATVEWVSTDCIYEPGAMLG